MINDDRYIPTDFALRHRQITPPKKRGFRPMQAATPENATRARLDAKHIARSNICPVCHMARPATGECC